MTPLITSLEQAGEGSRERGVGKIAASTPVGSWGDISTAPKDGTCFLIAYDNGAVRAGYYLDNSHTPFPWKGVRPAHGTEPVTAKITHWMAFPPPPSVSIDNGSRPQEAVPTEQADRPVLDWKEAASGLCAAVLKQAPLQIEKVSELLYEGLLNDVQDYLRENVDYNLSGELRRAQRDADRANNALAAVALELGIETRGFPVYPTPEMVEEQCRDAVVKLQAKATPQPADGCSSNEGAA